MTPRSPQLAILPMGVRPMTVCSARASRWPGRPLMGSNSTPIMARAFIQTMCGAQLSRLILSVATRSSRFRSWCGRKGLSWGHVLEHGPWRASLAVFTLDLDSELVFVGDAGTTEANDASQRTGVEASVFWQPTDWLVADLSAAYTDAEFDIPGNETEIPGAVDSVIGGGVLARFDPWTFSARLAPFRRSALDRGWFSDLGIYHAGESVRQL